MEIEMQTSSNRARALPAPGVARSGRLWVVVAAALLAFGAALSARAQSAGDPPSRAARLSEAEGQVWLYSSESDEWVTVARNRPLTTGDRIATDNGARAEITLGTTTLRLDAATELEIARLDDTRYSVRLRGGSVAARLRNPQSLGEFEMVTDEGRFRVLSVGRYRFDRFDQTSDVTVLNGQATYEARNTALPVTTGQHAQFWIDAAGVPQYAIVQPARDAFASWNDDRDRAEDRTVTAGAPRYVSPEMTGAEDLDRYGQWEQTPEYGALWVPRSVAADWAPYTTGHWAWVRPWGWTWVDDAPWGFAPFHYGRPAPTSRARSMRRRWWLGSAVRAAASRSPSAAARRSAGSRSRRARSTCRPTAPARATCSRSTSRTSPTSPTSRRSSTTATAKPTGATSPTASTLTRSPSSLPT
jgi:hypothetical protein